jgi:membrane protein required for colicin V production
MNWLDIAIIIVLILAAISGWRAGLVPGVLVLLGIALGILLAGRYGEPLGSSLVGNSPYAPWLGLAIILGLALLIAWFLGVFLQGVVHLLWLGWLDRLGGVAMGVALATLFLAALLLAADSPRHSPPWVREAVRESRLAPEVVAKGSFLRSMLPEDFKIGSQPDLSVNIR